MEEDSDASWLNAPSGDLVLTGTQVSIVMTMNTFQIFYEGCQNLCLKVFLKPQEAESHCFSLYT